MMAERFIAFAQSSLLKESTRLRAIANNAMDLIKVAVEQTADDIIEELQENYETAEEGETYVRTYELQGSWTRTDAFERGDGSIVCAIGNDVTDERGRFYAALVQGKGGPDGTQTFRHEGAGWKPIDEVANNHAHAQANRVRAAIKRAGNR